MDASKLKASTKLQLGSAFHRNSSACPEASGLRAPATADEPVARGVLQDPDPPRPLPERGRAGMPER